jgi:ABC-2 type transport system ATP-binding protein
MAQAIAHDPDLLLLDEPFNGLDPVGRHELSDLLLDWVRQGRSLIIASHILYEVEAISRSCLFICGGRLLASGTVEELNQLTRASSEVRIRCDRPHELAQRLWTVTATVAIRFEPDGTLTVTSGQAHEILRALPTLMSDTGIRVSELGSSDQSLQSLFDHLMRLHRGGE